MLNLPKYAKNFASKTQNVDIGHLSEKPGEISVNYSTDCSQPDIEMLNQKRFPELCWMVVMVNKKFQILEFTK